MADQINLLVDQGTTYSVNLEVKDADGNVVNLTGFSGAGQLRKQYNSNTATTFTVNVYSNGTVTAGLSANQTAALTEGRYVYDIEIRNALGEVSRIVEGLITITPEVTKV